MMQRGLMKKGQGISINVIVVAAIALLVLVVLAVVFLGRFGMFSEQTSNCESQGGRCVVGACPTGTTEYLAWTCPDTSSGAGQSCCLSVQG
jgi:hypothetical protein